MTEERGKKTRGGRAVLIYDGNCPVCGKAIEWIRENEKKGSFETIPCQAAEARRRFPFVEEADCMSAMQLILPDGTVLPGEKAMPEIVKRLRRYGPAADVFSLPGAEILSGAFYRWFADRRYHIAKILFPKKDEKGTRERRDADEAGST